MTKPAQPATKPEQLTNDECDTRALKALENASPRGLTASDVGLRIWKDRRLDRRGAGFAAIRVLRRLEAAGKIREKWGTYNATWHFIPTEAVAPPGGGQETTKREI